MCPWVLIYLFSIIYYINEYKEGGTDIMERQDVYIQKSLGYLKELHVQKEKLDAQIKEYERRIKEWMTFYQIEELIGPHNEKAQYFTVESKRFDTKSFKQVYGPLYNSFLKISSNQRFKFSY